MLEFFNQLDHSIFVHLNSLHHPILDKLMLFISYDYFAMGLLLITLLFLSLRKTETKTKVVLIMSMLFGFAISDASTSRLMKPGFERLRPCHNPVLAEQTYTANKKCGGGKFGFVSSHSSNSFFISMFFFLILRKKYRFIGGLFFYSSLVAYSRIYLGRHFPGDIFFGGLFGLLVGWLSYKVTCKFDKTFVSYPSSP